MVKLCVQLQVDPEKPVLVPGDPERAHETSVQDQGGVWYHDNLIAALVSIAIMSMKWNLQCWGHAFMQQLCMVPSLMQRSAHAFALTVVRSMLPHCSYANVDDSFSGTGGNCPHRME